MISFRGVAPASDDSIILTGFFKSPLPKISAERLAVPGRPGLLQTNRQHAERTIKAKFELNGRSAPANEILAAQLARWAESAAPGQLTHDERPGVYYLAQLDSLSDPDLAEDFPTVEAVFLCADPYAYAISESSAAVGAAFTVFGDIAAEPVIRFTASADTANPAWHYGTKTIALSGFTALTGHLIEIDSKNRLITDNGQSVMDKLTLVSDWLALTPGSATVTGSGGTVHWRSVYL